MEEHWKFQGKGVFKGQVKMLYEAKLEFPEELRVVETKSPCVAPGYDTTNNLMIHQKISLNWQICLSLLLSCQHS